MAAFVVVYPAMAGSRFDGGYYLSTHIPMVREKFGPHGLTDVRAMLAGGPDPTTLAAVAVLDFRDDPALVTALESPEAKEVFADVSNFTDIQPIAQRCG